MSKNLRPALRQDVKDALRDCALRRRDLKTGVAPGERAALDQTANRVLSAEQKDKPFGIAVAQLLRAFRPPDAQCTFRAGAWL